MRAKATTQTPQLVEILFGAYRRQILSLLLLRPDESFYVREIGRLTGVPAGSLHRELKLLSDAGPLQRSTTGNQVRYQVDRACPIQQELAGIFRKTAGLADVLREALAPIAGKIRLAFIFGSVAQGTEHPPDAAEVKRLLGAAARNFADARVTTISPETRFDAAYKTVMQAALAALMANGYRPDTNRPGHHVTVVQGLPLTIGLAPARSQGARYAAAQAQSVRLHGRRYRRFFRRTLHRRGRPVIAGCHGLAQETSTATDGGRRT